MKKSFLLLGISTMLLASCSQEDGLRIVKGQPDNSIAFRVRSAKATRAQDITTDNLNSFMVYGFLGDINERDENPDFTMTDYFGGAVKFSRSTDEDDMEFGYFRSETPYHYPANAGMTFVAYAPSDLAGVSVNNKGQLYIQNFTVNQNIEDQIDPVVDTTPRGQNYIDDETGELVEDAPYLTFKHTLTKVFVSGAWKGDSPYKYEVAGVKFGNVVKTADLTYDDRNCDEEMEEDKFFTWTPKAGANGMYGDFEYIFDEPVEIESSRTELMSGALDREDAKGSFLMIPQQLVYEGIDEGETEDYHSVKSLKMKDGVAYISLLIRIENNDILMYPYEEGVKNITKEINGKKYAWASFPIASKWRAGNYSDYVVDFSNGAGYVAAGAEGLVFEYEDEAGNIVKDVMKMEHTPILGEIKFMEDVSPWNSYDLITVDQNHEGVINGHDVEDPFGE